MNDQIRCVTGDFDQCCAGAGGDVVTAGTNDSHGAQAHRRQSHHVGIPTGPDLHNIERWKVCVASGRRTPPADHTSPAHSWFKPPITILRSIHTFRMLLSV